MWKEVDKGREDDQWTRRGKSKMDRDCEVIGREANTSGWRLLGGSRNGELCRPLHFLVQVGARRRMAREYQAIRDSAHS